MKTIVYIIAGFLLKDNLYSQITCDLSKNIGKRNDNIGSFNKNEWGILRMLNKK